MHRWVLIVLLFVGAHFGASYLVPLKEEDRGAFGGLLRWVWPWSVGDRGFLGMQDGLQVPMPGFWIAMAAAGALVAAALALLGWIVPTGWWRALTVVGAAALLVTLVGFLGWTKVLPIALAVTLIWIVLARVPVPT